MYNDEQYQEEIKRMEWEGGLIISPPKMNNSIWQFLIKKIKVWIKQIKS